MRVRCEIVCGKKRIIFIKDKKRRKIRGGK